MTHSVRSFGTETIKKILRWSLLRTFYFKPQSVKPGVILKRRVGLGLAALAALAALALSSYNPIRSP